jgi:hypothetical protein
MNSKVGFRTGGNRMPGGLISVFGEFDDFQAAMASDGVVGYL